ncbi:DUF308 domain-containing protein [Streptomyces caniscabiei]|uniref:HdeD family acid-resistance protein n=1 Tax=Streptomyces caniscabiei TaxID=2746961 RepID=UPI0029BF0F3B|nr:DUF308 domain-containing protein [Streptomyces caniscabiei]MDX2775877.1 DUF308 domain-containing protein [Streptomyces caniscabiei]
MLRKMERFVDNLWGWFVAQGVVTLLFGLVALFWPGVTLAMLVMLVAVYIFAIGVMLFVRGVVKSKKTQSWWFGALMGLVSAGLGVYLLLNPNVAIGTFLTVVGLLLLVRGVFDLFLAAYVIKARDGRALWILSGVVGIVAAIVLWRYPVEAGTAFVWVLGLYAVIAGVVSLIYAYRARGVIDKMKVELRLKK